MADEEHEEVEESTAPDANIVSADDEPRADHVTLAVEDASAEATVPEDAGADDDGEEEEEEEQEQAVVPEDVPPETVDEMQPDTVEANELGNVPPEPESEVVPLEEAGTPEDKGGDKEEEQEGGGGGEEEEEEEEGYEEQASVPEELPTETMDELQQQLDSAEEEVIVPAVTDEELATAEELPVEPQEIAASLTEDGPLEVPDDGYKETVASQPSDIEVESMEAGEDLLQSVEQLADQPEEVIPYPSSDQIDVLELADEHDELAEVDEGDQPDATRATDRVGMVQECPEVPFPPPLLVEGRDDIRSPKDETLVPTVLVCFYAQFVYECVLCRNSSGAF